MDDNKDSVSAGRTAPLTDKQSNNINGHGNDRSVFKQMMRQKSDVKEETVPGQPVALVAVTVLAGIAGLATGKMLGADIIAAIGNLQKLITEIPLF